MSKKPRAECQVCEREQALDRSGRMVNHGYKRPGYGFIVGNCFGVGYEPYPKTDALELWLENLERMKKTTEGKLNTVKRNEHETVPVTVYEDYKHVRKWFTRDELAERNKQPLYFGPGHDWEAKTERYIAELNRDLRQLESEKTRVQQRISKAREEES